MVTMDHHSESGKVSIFAPGAPRSAFKTASEARYVTKMKAMTTAVAVRPNLSRLPRLISH